MHAGLHVHSFGTWFRVFCNLLRIPAVDTISVAVHYYFLFDVYGLTFCTESSAILTSVSLTSVSPTSRPADQSFKDIGL